MTSSNRSDKIIHIVNKYPIYMKIHWQENFMEYSL